MYRVIWFAAGRYHSTSYTHRADAERRQVELYLMHVAHVIIVTESSE